MSTPKLWHHPLTGKPLAPIGYRKDGRAIWPVFGGSESPNQPTPPATPPQTPPATPNPPERPEGVSETEWAALGDPGRAALVREREARRTAEQALAAARQQSPQPPKLNNVNIADPPKKDGEPDIAALIQQAVQAATAPLLEAQAQRDAEAAATTIRDAVTTAASERFHDASDALAQIDLTTLTDGNGRPDEQKIAAALDALLAQKPHLGKAIDPRRQTAPGSTVGATPGAAAPLDDRVRATLARMQQASGVKFADA